MIKALEDASRDVRASAIRIAERWLGDPADPIQAAVLKRMDDKDWGVRHQLAASLGTLPAGARETAAAAFLERYAGDPIALDATLSGLRGSEAAVLEKMLQVRRAGRTEQQRSRAEAGRHEAAITMLSATILRGARTAPFKNVFAWTADANRPGWQRSALLRGAEVALLDAPMPGTPTGRRGAGAPAVELPCPTCPGGRAGPGGAYAFERRPARPPPPLAAEAVRACA